MGLFYTYYPKITANTPDEQKGPIVGITFVSSMLINQWKWKMFEMMFSGKEFFYKNNITKSWQVILNAMTIPSRMDFNASNTKETNTRMNAILHLLESLGFGGIIYLVNKYILMHPDIDIPKLPIPIQAALNLPVFLGVPIIMNSLSIIAGLIFGQRVNIRYCYSYPLSALNLKEWWKTWSIHVGEPLRNYVYIPLGGRKYPLFATSMVFLINGVDHVLLAGMINGGNYPWVGYAKSFAVISIGTAADMFLHSYFVKNKKKTNGTMIVNALRYVLMWSTMIGQVVWSWDQVFPHSESMEPYSIENKRKMLQST